MQDPRSYFKEHNLFSFDIKDHAEHNSVRIITSERFPNLVMLHYKEDCVFGNTWPPFAKMCRGLIVDMKNQVVLSYPFTKFFNIDQQPETAYEILKDRKEFEISEKLDGSMLISFLNPNDNQFYLTTKGSFDSDHGKVGTELFRKLTEREDCSKNQSEKLLKLAKEGTLMFELIDSRFRIVIDYKKKNYPEGLYLIGYRTREGRLYSYSEVAELAKELGLPGPNTYSFESLDQLIERTKEMPLTEEGFVLRYPDGLMVKVKGASYLKAHKFISHLSDKNILLAVREGVEGPFIEICPDEFRNEIVEKVAYFKRRRLDLMNQCYEYFAEAPKEKGRKEFALWINKNVPQNLRGCLFNLMDGKVLQDKQLYGIIEEMEKPSVETRI
jgi:RNA ligase